MSLIFTLIHFFIELELQFVLDAKKAKGRRLFFVDHEGQTSLQRQVTRGQFRKGGKWEYSFKAYLKPTIHDKLTSIDVEVSYELASSGGGRGNGFSIKFLRELDLTK